MAGSIWISLDIIRINILDILTSKDILSGYFIRIYINIKGYYLDKYQWISHMDIREDMSWICLDIMWISWADIFSG